MCNGTQIEMSCGHILTHYTQKCGKGQNKPCPEPRLDKPRTYLPDCCAECDPDFNSNRIKREHREQHAELVEQVRAKQRDGRSEEVERLLERMNVLSRSASQAIGEAKRLCSSGSDVEFPGGVLEPRGTSKWINGKCVVSNLLLSFCLVSRARTS